MASTRTTPKDVFLHLLAIIALYVSVGMFLSLLFEEINALFPDPLLYLYGADPGAVRVSMAALLILFPVFILVSWLIHRDLQEEPDRSQLAIRRWLLHLTLFLAALIIIVDLVTLVGYFLNGELTARFLLKVLAALLTAGAVFWYEISDLRNPLPKRGKTHRLWAIFSSAAVFVFFAAGFAIIGSPFTQRQARFDERRIQDLQSIQSEIINYWINKDKLPATITDLKDDIRGFTPPQDPATKVAYDYKVTSPLSFELCATFTTEQKDQSRLPSGPYDFGAPAAQWTHGTGNVCFPRTIDPDLYRQERAGMKGVPVQ